MSIYIHTHIALEALLLLTLRMSWERALIKFNTSSWMACLMVKPFKRTISSPT